MSDSYFQEMIRLKQVSTQPLVYESVTLPVRMGNALPIAYGGYTSCLAVQAAFHSLPGQSQAEKDDWAIYSANGLFLGPTMLEIPVQYSVTIIRDTRTFATRFITASQTLKGQPRACFCVTIDFTRKLPSSGPPHSDARLPMSYSLSPSRTFPHPDELVDFREEVERKVKEGEIPKAVERALESMFGLARKVSESRMIKGDILEETLFTIVPKRDTARQREVPDITQRRSADYFRSKDTLDPMKPTDGALPMSRRSIEATLIAFVIDGAIAFYPLTESGLGLSDAAACSSLDFAIRFHDDDMDFSQWHLREMRTYCADRQRTFNEALVWNLDGKLIASVTQQCVLRPKKEASGGSGAEKGSRL